MEQFYTSFIRRKIMVRKSFQNHKYLTSHWGTKFWVLCDVSRKYWWDVPHMLWSEAHYTNAVMTRHMVPNMVAIALLNIIQHIKLVCLWVPQLAYFRVRVKINGIWERERELIACAPSSGYGGFGTRTWLGGAWGQDLGSVSSSACHPGVDIP